MPEPPSAPLNRRTFVKTTATALTAAQYNRVLGANERVGVGFVGYGLIGERHVIDFKERSDVNMVGMAEAHSGRLDEALSYIGGGCKGYRDFRQLYENKDVEAVCIATADHWHALLSMMAMAAGKDVYVEKPLTLFVREGRWMIDVRDRAKRVVQVGTQQRSGPHYKRAKKLIEDGHLGKVFSVKAGAARNILPGYGSPAPGEPPPYLDWEMLIGPAPMVPYNPKRAIYHFRWFWDYSGGQMTNLGQHSFDIAYWFLGLKGPRAVTSFGGRWNLDDLGDTPDVQEALWEFPGEKVVMTWTDRETSRGDGAPGLSFYGTKGSLSIGRSGFQTEPDEVVPPENTVPQFASGQPAGGVNRIAEAGPRNKWTEDIDDSTGDSREQFKLHVEDFLNAIRTRQQPVSDLESGHQVAVHCHLANLSLRLNRRLEYDPDKEEILGDHEAANMLVRPYRAPWDRELRALGIGG
jgi:predicted dehydrogenase